EGLIARIEEEVNPTQVAQAVPLSSPAEEESPWAGAAESLLEEHRVEEATADNEPMLAAHEESPFEEPSPAFTTAALEIEAPEGMHVDPAPLEADVPLDMTADVFAPAEEQPHEDITSTLTMADLYAGQGLVADARQIYETILLRDPDNENVRAKLAALEEPKEQRHPKVVKLEAWLARVGRREVSHV
ncbi:MAG TPA: hypothetical protein VGJ82_02055, partial [Thermoanaerobaculia bacterium]